MTLPLPISPAPLPASDEPARFLAAHGPVDVVEVILPDTNGVLRGKWLPGGAIAKAFTDGVPLPMSMFGLDIWGREVTETGIHIEQGDKDGLCRPVAGRLVPVPWATRKTAQALITMYEADGVTPWELDPRQRLAAIADRLKARGLTPVVAFELEFYLVKPGADGIPVPACGVDGPIARQNMYSMSDLDDFATLMHEIREAAAIQNLPADTIISEAAPGQFEVNLYHVTDPLAAADDAVLLKRLIDGCARRHGLRATFMAKPFLDQAGNGMHVHCSLIDAAGRNVFGTEGGDTLLRHAVAGCLETLPETQALFVNSFNGYRRLLPGSYAPTNLSWGYDNRSVAVRVPNGPPKARRLEHRIAGADANPYLVLAAILAGMLHGLENALDPGEPVVGSAYDRQFDTLTASMRDAVDRFGASAFVAQAFGEEYRRVWTIMKIAEREAFERRITRLEYDTYM